VKRLALFPVDVLLPNSRDSWRATLAPVRFVAIDEGLGVALG
jgi:hypothetical protein